MVACATGKYTRTVGSVVEGPSVLDVAAVKDATVADELREALAATSARMQVLKDTADSGKMAYDQMIGEGNAAGNKIVQDAIDGLVAQTRAIARVVAALERKSGVVGKSVADSVGLGWRRNIEQKKNN